MSRSSFFQMTVLAVAFCAAAAISSPAQNLTTLLSFDKTNGAAATGTLIRGNDGNFYGTTSSGGTNLNLGTIFKITPEGTLTTLYNFCSQPSCVDGSVPYAGLLQAKNGNFYGTTYQGGSNCVTNNTSTSGCGTVFEITPEGRFRSLYSFCPGNSGVCNDGVNPQAPLIQGTDGNFYGVTQYGGGNAYDVGCFCSGGGTIFKITPAGALTTLYAFCNVSNSNSDCLDGAGPQGLLEASDGKFYGTTNDGGSGYDYKGGTVFEITPKGVLTTLYNFCSDTQYCLDGAYPHSGLIQATNGNFYGVTTGGGNNGWGTIFEMTPRGKLTTIHRFAANEGAGPLAALLQGKDGNFYGTAELGGAYSGRGNSSGTAFKITPQGKFTTLYNFCSQFGCTDGEYPQAGLVQGSNGHFYGLTYNGGTSNDGTVFSISAP